MFGRENVFHVLCFMLAHSEFAFMFVCVFCVCWSRMLIWEGVMLQNPSALFSLLFQMTLNICPGHVEVNNNAFAGFVCRSQ